MTTSKPMFCAVILNAVLTPAITRSEQIGWDAFTAAATIQDFEGLSASGNNPNSPFLIGNDTYDSDNHNVRWSSKFGSILGRSGVAISNNGEGSNVPTRYLEIILAKPALRAGIYVGFESPWAASAQFYDGESNLLGAIGLSGGASSSGFAGWQADGRLIDRIRVVDQTPNNFYSIIIDDFIQEVPEPTTAVMGCGGLLLVAGIFRRKRAFLMQ